MCAARSLTSRMGEYMAVWAYRPRLSFVRPDGIVTQRTSITSAMQALVEAMRRESQRVLGKRWSADRVMGSPESYFCGIGDYEVEDRAVGIHVSVQRLT